MTTKSSFWSKHVHDTRKTFFKHFYNLVSDRCYDSSSELCYSFLESELQIVVSLFLDLRRAFLT
jgi:hypothetical protein